MNIHLVVGSDLLWLLGTHLKMVQGKVMPLDRHWLMEQGKEVVDTLQRRLWFQGNPLKEEQNIAGTQQHC